MHFFSSVGSTSVFFWCQKVSFICLLFPLVGISFILFLFLLQPIILFSAIPHMSSFILSLNSPPLLYNCQEHIVSIINSHGRIDILYAILPTVCLDSVFPPIFSRNWKGWCFDMVFHLALTIINAQLQPERSKILEGDWQIYTAQKWFVIGTDVRVVHCCCRSIAFFCYINFI